MAKARMMVPSAMAHSFVRFSGGIGWSLLSVEAHLGGGHRERFIERG
jgi:hypothetical protein